MEAHVCDKTPSKLKGTKAALIKQPCPIIHNSGALVLEL